MVKIDDDDLNGIKVVLRKLMNKNRFGGNHTEETQLKRWGMTEDGIKWCVNANILLKKPSQGNWEYAVNSKELKTINWILNQVRDVSELNS